MSTTPKLWHIYFLENCPYTHPHPKDKLLIPVCHDQNILGFLINSEIDVWIQINPLLSSSQIEISASEHSCLKYDSFVNCHELYNFDDFQLVNVRDEVSEEVKQEILKAVEESKTISIKEPFKKLKITPILEKDEKLIGCKEKSIIVQC